ncbi:hypothetical protein COS75_00475 [Candidatus Pacearchaeota archaeon CG06_land_8_20_14_3_00_35_12]|nr:MAG: hypothetical protein COS75_00475 [Candidatus Pacearchaeota archaeon CG06_land_8_20_14_3_00_35_12]
MPLPKPNETRAKYLSRCIPILKKEGKTQSQAIGGCFGRWKFYSKEGKERKNQEARLKVLSKK